MTSNAGREAPRSQKTTRTLREENFWEATATPPQSWAGTPVPPKADVVVIGGGYTGLSAALHLAEGGAKVVVLEKHTVGWGGSSRNGGQVVTGHGSPEELKRAYGQERGDRLFRSGIEQLHLVEKLIAERSLDCDYSRKPLLTLAWSRRDLARFERELRESEPYGLTGRIVTRDELDSFVGTTYYPGGVVYDLAGVLQPAKYSYELARIAASAGAVICEGTAAVSIDDREHSVKTTRGTIHAPHVIVASGAYVDGVDPWLRRRVLPVGSYIVVTEPLDPAIARSISPQGHHFNDSKKFIYYWRILPDNRLMFGGRASFWPTSVRRAAGTLRRAIAKVHPQAREASIEYAWTGLIGIAFDEMHHLGQRGSRIHAFGVGVATGTQFGRTAAELVLKPANEVDAPYLGLPFPGAPIHERIYSGRPWFLPFAGEWYRMRDFLARRR